MLCLGAAEGCRRGISCAAPLVDFFDSRDEDMHIRGGSWEMAERDQQTRCKRSGSYPETTVELQHLLGRPLSEVCFQQKEKNHDFRCQWGEAEYEGLHSFQAASQ